MRTQCVSGMGCSWNPGPPAVVCGSSSSGRQLAIALLGGTETFHWWDALTMVADPVHVVGIGSIEPHI